MKLVLDRPELHCSGRNHAPDQALTRERYLRLVEAVPTELRQRYLKVYAYY